MPKIFRIILLASTLAVLFFLFFSLAEIISIFTGQQPASVCVKQNCFGVEVAKTIAERQKGLMFREKLDENKGMLFVFEQEDIYPFWMKNTLIPLDIIWVNGQNKIVFIKENAQPCLADAVCENIIPDVRALYALEINGGLSYKFGFQAGDTAKIDF